MSKAAAAIDAHSAMAARWTRARRSPGTLLDRFGGANDGHDSGSETDEKSKEEAPMTGACPPIDQQPQTGPHDDGDDEGQPDAAQRAEGLHRFLRRVRRR